jgi:hypothetical protein
MKRPRLRTVVLLTLVAALLLAAGPALASSEYTVESTTSIDTPSRTVTVQGNEYTVTSLGYRDVGETVPVEVTRPGSGRFTVHMYNGNGLTMDSVEGDENGTHTLDQTTSLERGTYVLALNVDGEDGIQKIQPIVMSGYDFAVDAPQEVSEDERVSITIELTGETKLPNYVDVAVMNDSTHRYDAVRVDDRTYNVVIEDLDPDEYRLYAAARVLGDRRRLERLLLVAVAISGVVALWGLAQAANFYVEGLSIPWVGSRDRIFASLGNAG